MKRIISLFFLCISFAHISGQIIERVGNKEKAANKERSAETSAIRQNYTPSPEAYAMLQYVETPVSYYTGVPDISIPLYTIKVGDFELPISLKYHASGIKVAQEASRVGLGWSLYAGGEITRVIQDRDDIHPFWDYFLDDNAYGYWRDTTSYNMAWNGVEFYFDENDRYMWMDEDYPECVDSEPDIFYFNFCGYQGTFYAKKGAGSDDSIKEKWVLQSKEPGLHIDYNINKHDESEGYFVVTSLDGTKFKFDAHNSASSCGVGMYEKDNSMYGRYPCLGGFYHPDGPILNPTGEYRDFRITSWCLTEIELTSGEKITFGYDRESYYSPLFETKSIYSEVTKDEYVNPVFEDQKDEIRNRKSVMESTFMSASATLVNDQPVLKKITWDGGCMDFVPGDIRRDVRKVPDPGSQTYSEYDSHKLSEIQVCSLAGTQKTVVNTYKLHHSYFGGSANTNDTESYLRLRLKLDSVTVYGKGNKSQTYSMGYYAGMGLPEKNSDQCDKWGYCAKNTPNFYETYTAYESWPRYKNRKPDFIKEGERYTSTIPTAKCPNPEDAKTWTLTELTTPTGGTTRYFYEGNAANEVQIVSTPNITGTTFISTRPTVSILPSEISETDTIAYFWDIPANCGFLDLHCYCAAGPPEQLTDTEIFSIYDADGFRVCSQTGIPPGAKIGHYSEKLYDFDVRIPVYEKGKYKIVLPKNREWIREVKLTCKKIEVTNTTVTTGGLRVSKIESPVGTRCFSYMSDSLSSGQLNRSPMYAYPTYWYTYNSLGYLVHVDYYMRYSSAPCQPLANPISGGYMGYSRVQESITDENGETEKKEYCFYNQKENPMRKWYDKGSTPPLNGRPRKELVYDKDGELLKTSLWNYRETVCDTILGRAHEDAYAPSLYHWYGYETHLMSQKEITKGSVSSECDTLNVLYAYDSACHLPSSILYKSAHSTKEERMTYSSDYNNGIWNMMKSKGLLSLPVEKSVYMDNTLIQKDVRLYSADYLYRPYKDFYYTGRESQIPQTNDLRDEGADCTYSYYPYGRLTQATSRTGQSMVLLWGYNRQHIIAQITNATLEEVRQSGINPEALAAKPSPSDAEWQAIGHLREALPEAGIVTCKYAPMIGIIERTDEHGRTAVYTYDDFNRLENVKEVKNGQPVPVMRYEYHLQTEK